MTIIAYAGEKIKGRDGKVIATVAEDIHSGDFNFRPGQFNIEGGHEGGYLPEEIMEYMRGKMSSPSPDPKAEKATAKDKPEVKRKAKAKPAKQVAAKQATGQVAALADLAKRK